MGLAEGFAAIFADRINAHFNSGPPKAGSGRQDYGQELWDSIDITESKDLAPSSTEITVKPGSQVGSTVVGVGGAVGGAEVGAALMTILEIGGSFAGPIGTVIGGAVGYALGKMLGSVLDKPKSREIQVGRLGISEAISNEGYVIYGGGGTFESYRAAGADLNLQFTTITRGLDHMISSYRAYGLNEEAAALEKRRNELPISASSHAEAVQQHQNLLRDCQMIR